MHIMQLVSGRHPNGAVLHCLDLCRELSRRGHRVTIAHRMESFDCSRFDGEAINVIDCDFKRWPISKLKDFSLLIQRQRVDLIHTHMSSAHLYGVLMRRFFGVPTIATAHVSFFQPHWAWNDFVIANSAATYKFQNRFNFVRKSRLEKIHCFIDSHKFDLASDSDVDRQRSEWNANRTDKVIGIVGELISRKGQDKVVEAMPAILKAIPNVKLVFVGTTDLAKPQNVKYNALLKKRVADLNLDQHVIWNGYSKQIDVVMNAIDVCAVPSLREPFGLVAAEAMSAKKPVVAHAVGGLTDIVNDGQNGLLFENLSPGEISQKLIKVLQNDVLSARLGVSGKAFVEENFGIENQVRKIESTYERVLKIRKRVPLHFIREEQTDSRAA